MKLEPRDALGETVEDHASRRILFAAYLGGGARFNSDLRQWLRRIYGRRPASAWPRTSYHPISAVFMYSRVQLLQLDQLPRTKLARHLLKSCDRSHRLVSSLASIRSQILLSFRGRSAVM
jgi:hypothetical protein